MALNPPLRFRHHGIHQLRVVHDHLASKAGHRFADSLGCLNEIVPLEQREPDSEVLVSPLPSRCRLASGSPWFAGWHRVIPLDEMMRVPKSYAPPWTRQRVATERRLTGRPPAQESRPPASARPVYASRAGVRRSHPSSLPRIRGTNLNRNAFGLEYAHSINATAPLLGAFRSIATHADTLPAFLAWRY